MQDFFVLFFVFFSSGNITRDRGRDGKRWRVVKEGERREGQKDRVRERGTKERGERGSGGGEGGGSSSIGSRFVLDCDDQCVVFLSGDVKSGVSGAAGRYEVPKVAGCQLLGLEVGEPRQENARKVVVCTRSANTQQSGRPASGLRYSGGTRTSFQPFYTRLSPLARCTSIGTS